MRRFSGYQRRVLLVLTCINFVNWIDRQVVYPLFPLIREEFRVSYEQLGMLVAAFSIVHSIGALGLGRVADRTSRKKVIGAGILVWSAATFFCGLARSFRGLVTSRALVGIGEASYVPAATAIISGAFPREVRARVQAFFDVGMFLGGSAGFVLGGLIAASLGWRPAFFCVAIPGLVLAASAFRLPEVRAEATAPQMPIRDLARFPAYLFVVLSGGLVTFAGHTYVIWGAEFLHRYKGLDLSRTGVLLGLTLVTCGMPGVMTGAFVADRLARRLAGGRAISVACGCLVAAPLIVCALHVRSTALTIAAFGASTFFLTWYHGPVTAIVHDIIPARAHATAMGAYYFAVNLFATTGASWLVGRVADRYGLTTGMHMAVALQAAGASCFLVVALLISRQVRQAGLSRAVASVAAG